MTEWNKVGEFHAKKLDKNNVVASVYMLNGNMIASVRIDGYLREHRIDVKPTLLDKILNRKRQIRYQKGFEKAIKWADRMLDAVSLHYKIVPTTFHAIKGYTVYTRHFFFWRKFLFNDGLHDFEIFEKTYGEARDKFFEKTGLCEHNTTEHLPIYKIGDI